MEQQFSPIINIMRKAVGKASRSLVRDFGEVENLQVSRKGPGDFVSAADFKSEKIIVEELRKARPDYPVLTEESGFIAGADDEYRWIVDPLDGTTNFLHGFPYFCITVALEKTHPNGRSEIVAAVTEAPILKELYWAEKGQGAWLECANSGDVTRLRVANRRKLSAALLCVGSYAQDVRNNHLSMSVAAVRCLGSTALSLAHVAAGRFDCFVQSKAFPWDLAAGILINLEAGGYVSDLKGGAKILKSNSVIATNDRLHDLVLKSLLS